MEHCIPLDWITMLFSLPNQFPPQPAVMVYGCIARIIDDCHVTFGFSTVWRIGGQLPSLNQQARILVQIFPKVSLLNAVNASLSYAFEFERIFSK